MPSLDIPIYESGNLHTGVCYCIVLQRLVSLKLSPFSFGKITDIIWRTNVGEFTNWPCIFPFILSFILGLIDLYVCGFLRYN